MSACIAVVARSVCAGGCKAPFRVQASGWLVRCRARLCLCVCIRCVMAPCLLALPGFQPSASKAGRSCARLGARHTTAADLCHVLLPISLAVFLLPLCNTPCDRADPALAAELGQPLEQALGFFGAAQQTYGPLLTAALTKATG